MKPAEPTATGERLEILDILRGFALSGVLLVNFTGALPKAVSVVDRATGWLIALFATDSFYPAAAVKRGSSRRLDLRLIQSPQHAA